MFLFFFPLHQVMGCPITIADKPRFAWRGMMIDTANHYLQPSTLMTIIDGMAMDRFNVLHWHIVDSYSFPLQLKNFSNITANGRW